MVLAISILGLVMVAAMAFQFWRDHQISKELERRKIQVVYLNAGGQLVEVWRADDSREAIPTPVASGIRSEVLPSA